MQIYNIKNKYNNLPSLTVVYLYIGTHTEKEHKYKIFYILIYKLLILHGLYFR